MEALMGSYNWHRYSAAESYERILQGEYPWVAFGDFLDDWLRSESEDRLELVSQPLGKASTPDEQHWAALFAAAIEQLCISEVLLFLPGLWSPVTIYRNPGIQQLEKKSCVTSWRRLPLKFSNGAKFLLATEFSCVPSAEAQEVFVNVAMLLACVVMGG